MKKLIGLIVLLGFSLNTYAKDFDMHIETVIGYIHDQNGLIFQVFNAGCTSKEDFYLKLEKNKNETLVTLYRKNPDFCRAFYPYGKFIQFTYNELRINSQQSFQVLNPINPGYRY